MAVKIVESLAKRKTADVLILPFFEGKKPAFTSKGLNAHFEAPMLAGDFNGEKESILCHYPQKFPEKRLVLVGLGKENGITKEILRRSYANALANIKGKSKSINVVLPETDALESAEAVVEGVLLANYVYDVNKSEKDKFVEEITFIGGDSKAIKHAETICAGVCFTRDLVIGNADLVTPTFLAAKAKELEGPSIKTTVLNREQIKKQKLGLIEAVSRGATTEPALIIIEYRGNPKSKESTALIGKGVTYDTGGLNLKPTGSMETMRDDMSGAGAVLGVLKTIAQLKLPLNVIGVLTSAENAIGPDSYKPGDVFSSYSGITVEVTNTDAEGRLVLADAISYVQKKFSPKRIVDIATLTGGAVVALGEEVSALMATDDELAEQLMAAGESTYERLCRMPLYEEYNQLLKSKVADIKNSGPRKASPIQGAIFLKRFVEKTSWAHLDIAGTAFPEQLKSYQPVQASGVGVRLLTTFLEHLAYDKS